MNKLTIHDMSHKWKEEKENLEEIRQNGTMQWLISWNETVFHLNEMDIKEAF